VVTVDVIRKADDDPVGMRDVYVDAVTGAVLRPDR